MPSEEGPAQKVQRQSQDSATIGDVVDFGDIRMFGSADKGQSLFDPQQSVSCALPHCPNYLISTKFTRKVSTVKTLS